MAALIPVKFDLVEPNSWVRKLLTGDPNGEYGLHKARIFLISLVAVTIIGLVALAIVAWRWEASLIPVPAVQQPVDDEEPYLINLMVCREQCQAGASVADVLENQALPNDFRQQLLSALFDGVRDSIQQNLQDHGLSAAWARMLPFAKEPECLTEIRVLLKQALLDAAVYDCYSLARPVQEVLSQLETNWGFAKSTLDYFQSNLLGELLDKLQNPENDPYLEQHVHLFFEDWKHQVPSDNPQLMQLKESLEQRYGDQHEPDYYETATQIAYSYLSWLGQKIGI